MASSGGIINDKVCSSTIGTQSFCPRAIGYWNSLPPEIQSAFRKASDESFLRRIGQIWSDYEKPGIDRLIQYKKKHIVLTEAETKAFEDKLKPVTERWIKEVEKEGIDGRKLVNKARKLIKKYEE